VTRAVVFDIEGTIGDISFVRNVLFPYARERLLDHLKSNWDSEQIRPIVEAARQASGQALTTPAQAAAQFAAWIDEDRKITPLKTLQGLIWREGYETGVLKAHLYDDAVSLIRDLARAGKRLFIYSSGSIEAQKLYMAYSVAGDLTGLIEDYFDTTTGPKAEAASYGRIAGHIGLPPRDITFFSDAVAEVMAARTAGFAATCVNRAPASPVKGLEPGTPVISDFTQTTLS
jgi:enolase-phosphatase E1